MSEVVPVILASCDQVFSPSNFIRFSLALLYVAKRWQHYLRCPCVAVYYPVSCVEEKGGGLLVRRGLHY